MFKGYRGLCFAHEPLSMKQALHLGLEDVVLIAAGRERVRTQSYVIGDMKFSPYWTEDIFRGPLSDTMVTLDSDEEARWRPHLMDIGQHNVKPDVGLSDEE